MHFLQTPFFQVLPLLLLPLASLRLRGACSQRVHATTRHSQQHWRIDWHRRYAAIAVVLFICVLTNLSPIYRAHMNAAIGGVASPPPKPLYITLLDSYLKHFIPLGTPYSGGGELLLHAAAQFWLCQNAPPLVTQQLSQILTFQDTKASLLGCIEFLVRYLNAHESARIASFPATTSAHAAWQSPMYHFFDKQLEKLPDISARVISLVRIYALYLQPWQPGTITNPIAATTDKSVNANASGNANAGQNANGGGSSGVSSLDNSRQLAQDAASAAAAAEAWSWAPFVKANYLLYIRLLISFSREVRIMCCRPLPHPTHPPTSAHSCGAGS